MQDKTQSERPSGFGFGATGCEARSRAQALRALAVIAVVLAACFAAAASGLIGG